VPADIKFFDGEQYDLIVSAIQVYLRNAQSNTRAEELATAIINNNPLKGEGKNLFVELQRIFKSSAEINASAESELRGLGFVMLLNKAGHNKLIYQGNDNYKFTTTCLPNSEMQATARVSEIKSQLNIYRD
jgi:hypothetical protein